MEGQLDPVALPGEDDPGAVGVVGVAVREPGALDGAVGALDQASTGLTWERTHKDQAKISTLFWLLLMYD